MVSPNTLWQKSFISILEIMTAADLQLQLLNTVRRMQMPPNWKHQDASLAGTWSMDGLQGVYEQKRGVHVLMCILLKRNS